MKNFCACTYTKHIDELLLPRRKNRIPLKMARIHGKKTPKSMDSFFSSPSFLFVLEGNVIPSILFLCLEYRTLSSKSNKSSLCPFGSAIFKFAKGEDLMHNLYHTQELSFKAFDFKTICDFLNNETTFTRYLFIADWIHTMALDPLTH